MSIFQDFVVDADVVGVVITVNICNSVDKYSIHGVDFLNFGLHGIILIVNEIGFDILKQIHVNENQQCDNVFVIASSVNCDGLL